MLTNQAKPRQAGEKAPYVSTFRLNSDRHHPLHRSAHEYASHPLNHMGKEKKSPLKKKKKEVGRLTSISLLWRAVWPSLLCSCGGLAQRRVIGQFVKQAVIFLNGERN